MRVKARAISIWQAVRSSYWFVPTVMAILALAVGMVTLRLDRTVGDRWMKGTTWVYVGDAEGARSLLSAIASSMITVAGVVFSITIVALTLASSQFGPRILRTFMRDLSNQVVLGTFVAAFLYSLLVLRSVHGDQPGSDTRFVPQLSMLVASLLAVASLGVLIYFIHHIAESIQAPNVISAVARDLHHAIEELYPEKLGEGATGERDQRQPEGQAPARFQEEAIAIRADHAGYVQVIETEELMDEARQHELVLRIERRPGHYVYGDDVIVRVWPAERADQGVRRRLRQTFTISSQRTPPQDAEFLVEQLVQVAVRALSPGVNDPFTAIQCVDRLGEAVARLAGRAMPSPYRLDDGGHLRVISYPVTFKSYLDTAFNQIRQNAQRSPAVLIRLLEAMGRVGLRVRRDEDRACVMEHARMIYEQAASATTAGPDRAKVQQRYARTLNDLNAPPRAADGSR